ncbi:mechanosensitive ion channel family protein [Cyanothece sp. BG0011]|uniref:mechanosensitive ion channel family protein n=1 Tax=Cyanothece sp. BG0011 TaxID=2082950 RepID=UPI000D1F0AC5|nr:mechanosensitive ion channel family protein [Cyanothece sp. BG0011]
MRKKLKNFLLVLVITLSIVVSPFVYAQDNQETANKIDGYPVILNDDILFKIQAPTGSFSSEERASTITHRLETFAEDNSLSVESIELETQDNITSIIAEDTILATLTEEDANAARKTRQELSEEYLEIIKTSITQFREERTLIAKIFSLVWTLLATLSLLLIFTLMDLVFPKIFNLLNRWKDTVIPSLRIQNVNLISSTQVTNTLIAVIKTIRVILVLLILFLYIPFILRFFPLTRKISQQIFDYIFKAVLYISESVLNYIPNIFMIGLIAVSTYYIIRFCKFVFKELERGNITIPGFYQDWATPTYNILQFLIIALAAVVAVPYLPGFDSPAFRGISVFLGVLFSLGSTSAVANTVGGVILIYTRAFQLGDRVQIGDIIGDIEDKTLLVTRIRTPKNVIVTLPNATVLNSNVINFSASARETGIPLIISTTITLGYDVPWRKVHQVLLAAADVTDSLLKEPKPFVLQTSLDDFYVSYELNVYTEKTRRLFEIYSDIHQNIQDKCNESDIEILSPHYSALRDGNQNTIPSNYLPKDYQAPGFRIENLGNNVNKHS